jgi:hypothetical protein
MNTAIASGTQAFWVDARRTFTRHEENSHHLLSDRTHEMAQWIRDHGPVRTSVFCKHFGVSAHCIQSKLTSMSFHYKVWHDDGWLGTL